MTNEHTPNAEQTLPVTHTTTPSLEKYQRVKSQLSSDTLLLFRVGGFYELYFEDAKHAAPILGVNLETRKLVSTLGVCGVPSHALDTYLAKLIRAGKKVAICHEWSES